MTSTSGVTLQDGRSHLGSLCLQRLALREVSIETVEKGATTATGYSPGADPQVKALLGNLAVDRSAGRSRGPEDHGAVC